MGSTKAHRETPARKTKPARAAAAYMYVRCAPFLVVTFAVVIATWFWPPAGTGSPLPDASVYVREVERLDAEGRDHLLREEFEQAHEFLDQALAIAEKHDFLHRRKATLESILANKASAVGNEAIKTGRAEQIPIAVEYYWQAYNISSPKSLRTLANIATLYAAAGSLADQTKVSRQLLNELISDPRKVKQLEGPQSRRPEDLEKARLVATDVMRRTLSEFMISARRLGDANLAADYFYKMKELYPEQIPWKDTYQTTTNYIADDNLNDHPWWDASAFPWTRGLEAKHKDILAELRSYLADNEGEGGAGFQLGEDHTLIGVRDSESQIQKEDWSEVILWDSDGITAGFSKNCNRFPITCSVMHRIPMITGTNVLQGGIPVMGQVTFFKLKAGSHLVPHVGTNNFRLTAHLGLIVPEGDLTLRVANETRGWEQGKVIVFDDSFEHEVRHNGIEDRYVLYMSLWKKEFGETVRSNAAQFWKKLTKAGKP